MLHGPRRFSYCPAHVLASPAYAFLATHRRRITPQGQRDLDSIAGQIGAK